MKKFRNDFLSFANQQIKKTAESCLSFFKNIPETIKTGIEHTDFSSTSNIVWQIVIYVLSILFYVLCISLAKHMKKNYIKDCDFLPKTTEKYMVTDKFIMDARGKIIKNPNFSKKERKKVAKEQEIEFLGGFWSFFVSVFIGKLKCLGFLLFLCWLIYITANYQLRSSIIVFFRVCSEPFIV